jgi:hypothetical protein
MTWRSAADVAQRFSLTEHSAELLSDLFSTSLSILNGEKDFISILRTVIQDISRQSMTSSAGNAVDPFSPNSPNSLGGIAWRIGKTDKTGIMLEFENAVSLVQFAVKLDVLREARGAKSIIEVIREEMRPGGSLWSENGLPICTESQAKFWKQSGYLLAEFVGAGKCCQLLFEWSLILNSIHIRSNDFGLCSTYPQTQEVISRTIKRNL